MKRFLIFISIMLLSVFAFFFSNIKGYYRFKQYCDAEGGLRVYEQLERDVGWWAKDKYDAEAAALIPGVGFVRYEDKSDGKIYDVKYIGGKSYFEKKYAVTAADESKDILYSWGTVNKKVINENRLRKYGREVSDFKNNKIIASHYFFGYEKFNREKTILDMPSEIYCFNDVSDTNNLFGGWVRSLAASFKN